MPTWKVVQHSAAMFPTTFTRPKTASNSTKSDIVQSSKILAGNVLRKNEWTTILDFGFSLLLLDLYQSGSKEDLEHLLQTQTVPGPKGAFCKLCTKFVGNKSIKRHMMDIHLQCGPTFTCPICAKFYRNKNSFQVHIIRIHPELKSYDLKHFANVKEEIWNVSREPFSLLF